MKGASDSVRSWALPMTIALVPLLILAMFIASSFEAAPEQDGFYPPLPQASEPASDGPTPTPPQVLCDFSQEFENVSSLIAQGWIMQNNSQPIGITPNWFQGNPAPFGGRINSYVATNYQSGSGL